MTLLDLSLMVFALGFGAAGWGVWTGRWRGWEREPFFRARALAVPYFALAVLCATAGLAWVRLTGEYAPRWTLWLPAGFCVAGFWMYLTEGAWTPALLPPWYRRYLTDPDSYPPAPGPEAGRLELSPTRRLLVVLATGVAFLPAGAWLVQRRDAVGLAVLALGAGLIVWAAFLLARRDRLVLTPEGLLLRRRGRSGPPIPWAAVERVAYEPPGWTRSGRVRLVLRPDWAAPPAEAGLTVTTRGALPAFYGVDGANLVDLLDRWRTAATGLAPAQQG